MKKFKLKKGDIVWIRAPIRGVIKSVDKKYGYTVQVKIAKNAEWGYYNDDEIFGVKKNAS